MINENNDSNILIHVWYVHHLKQSKCFSMTIGLTGYFRYAKNSHDEITEVEMNKTM